MMKFLFASFLLLVMSLGCAAQYLEYSIIWKEDSIGYIKANRTLTDTSEYRNFEGASRFRVIFGFTTGYSHEAFFEKGKLTKSTVLDKMNDNVRGSATIEWLNNKYMMRIDGEQKTWETPIIATVGSLYYQEPAGLSQIFSERYGRFLEIITEGKGKYRLRKPDDRFNTYQYENGKCTIVEVDNTLTNFSFHLVR